MTTRELLAQIGHAPVAVAIALAAPALLALLLGLFPARGGIGRSPAKYAYSLAVYATCTTGVLALMVDLYTLLFTHENLLDTNPLVTIAPVAATVLTLGLIGRQVDFRALPGFGRLSGLLLMIAASFAAVFMLARTHVMVLFHGGFGSLLLGGVAIFLVLSLGSRLAFSRRKPHLDRRY